MEHVRKDYMVKGCDQEASYWIDTSEGFVERLLKTEEAPSTFYLCIDHQYEHNGKDENDGYCVHLRIDTGEISKHEIGKYACHPDCDLCAD